MEIITRETWGAEPYRGTPVPLGRVERIVVHHAGGHVATTRAAGIEAVQRIQVFHQRDRGWSDIAYHYLVSQAGDVFEGRGRFADGQHIRGAHVGGLNRGSLGICLLGNFEQDCPGLRQLSALTALCAELVRTHRLSPSAIAGHRDHGQTLCPGRNLYAELDAVRERVAEMNVHA